MKADSSKVAPHAHERLANSRPATQERMFSESPGLPMPFTSQPEKRPGSRAQERVQIPC